MSANNALHIAVLGGDGIGPEVMAPALEVLRKIEATSDLKFRFTDAPAGANNYLATGKSMPDSTVRLCEEADAILLGACGLPSVRYPDNTEIAPQIELRFHFDLYAGVRPARLIPGVPSPIVGADQRGIDLVLIRESTEGLFASMGKGVVTDTEARETLVITRKTSERLFEFSFRLAERRKARGKTNGGLTCVDKANVFRAFAFFREMFDEAAKRHPGVKADRVYVDACSLMMVKRPWDFDVMVTENMFGDILSDLAAGLIGGLGMAPSADIGDRYAVFQPCHGTAPDIMGQGKANPTAMILSAAMMLDWLADKHGLESAAEAGERIERAVDKAYAEQSSRWNSAAATAPRILRKRCWRRCNAQLAVMPGRVTKHPCLVLRKRDVDGCARPAMTRTDPRYFPLNCGLRFSMKAVRPSRKSSLSMQAMPIVLIASMSRLLSSFNTSAIVILAALIASGALPEMVRAISMVASHNSASGSTRSTNPIRNASAASIRMPVYMMSRAQDGPTSETRCLRPS